MSKFTGLCFILFFFFGCDQKERQLSKVSGSSKLKVASVKVLPNDDYTLKIYGTGSKVVYIVGWTHDGKQGILSTKKQIEKLIDNSNFKKLNVFLEGYDKGEPISYTDDRIKTVVDYLNEKGARLRGGDSSSLAIGSLSFLRDTIPPDKPIDVDFACTSLFKFHTMVEFRTRILLNTLLENRIKNKEGMIIGMMGHAHFASYALTDLDEFARKNGLKIILYVEKETYKKKEPFYWHEKCASWDVAEATYSLKAHNYVIPKKLF